AAPGAAEGRLRGGGRPRLERGGGSAAIRRRVAARRGTGGASRSWVRPSPAAMSAPRAFGVVVAAALAVVLAFLALPMAALFVHTSPGRLAASLGDPAALDALSLSLRTSVVALAVIVLVGTPAAYLLATRSFRGR